jgi:uncharacterized protein YecE (DUF72 family)
MYDDWRGRLYPERWPKRRWLERYAEVFDTVEVNATFYRLPRRQTVEAWVAQTPERFVFAVKASRFLTHVKRLRAIEQGIERFYEPLEPLRASGRLGPVLWQLPESFKRDDNRLAELLELLPEGLHAVEFRDPSWFADEVLGALAARGVALALGDHPKRRFASEQATAPWRYIRFHYGSRGRDGNYSRAELERWAAKLRGWRRAHAVYAYFNNDWRGFAPANARLLLRLLERSS